MSTIKSRIEKLEKKNDQQEIASGPFFLRSDGKYWKDGELYTEDEMKSITEKQSGVTLIWDIPVPPPWDAWNVTS